MMDVTFDLATPADDPDIRRLLAATPMPGSVAVTYEREPHYFLGCTTLGPLCQVLVARLRATSQVVGVLCRSARPLFVNGVVREVGYLSQMRIDPRFRGRWLLLGGGHALRQLHADGRAPAYLATITAENTVAQGVLVDRPRRHFPALRAVADVHTLALVAYPRRALRAPGLAVERGSAHGLGDIVAFLRREGAARQFFPAYTAEDFLDSPATRGFRVEDLFVARRDGHIVGVIGLWDQSAYKQTVVRAYSPALARLRPAYNLGARLLRAQPLPAPGQPIHAAYASFVCVAPAAADAFRVLLRHACNAAAARRYAYLMIGLVADDPLLAEARRYAHIAYRSRLYTVCWPDGGSFHDQLDRRMPYVEIAAL